MTHKELAIMIAQKVEAEIPNESIEVQKAYAKWLLNKLKPAAQYYSSLVSREGFRVSH